MTSKSLLGRLVKDEVKKRNWLFILSILAFCLVLPGFVLNEVQSEAALVENGTVTAEMGRLFYQRLIGFSSQRFYLYGAGAMGFLAAASGFAYLHSRSKLDFFHSLPVRRETWYLVQYLSGLVMFAAPFLVGMGVNLSIGAIYHFLEIQGILTAVKAVSVYLVIYLLAFSISALAVMLTGKVLISVLLAPVMAFYGVGAVFLYKTFQETFFTTYFAPDESKLDMAVYFSPAYLVLRYVEGLQRKAGGGEAPGFLWVCFLAILLETAAFAYAGLLLYRRRRTEAAGSAIVFPRVTNVLNVFIAVLAALTAGIYIKKFSYTQSDLWFFGGLVLGVVVAYVLLEFIFQGDLRTVWRLKPQFAVMGLAAFGIACLFRFDLLGYDRYFPEMEKVDSMSVQSSAMSEMSNQFYFYTDVSSTAQNSGERMILNAYQMNEFEPIYLMAENGVENVKRPEEENFDKARVSVKYNLKSGKQVYRSYYVDDGVFAEQTEALFAKDGFVEVLYPIFNRENDERLVNIEGNGLQGEAGYRELTVSDKEEKERFLKCYQEELSTIRYSEVHSSELIGSLTLSYEGEDLEGSYFGYSDEGYPVLRRFENTIQALEELGIVFQERIDASIVQDIGIVDNSGKEYHLMGQEAGEPDLITGEEKQDLLDALEYQNKASMSQYGGADTVYLFLYGGENGYLQDYRIAYQELPEGILRVLEERGFSMK